MLGVDPRPLDYKAHSFTLFLHCHHINLLNKLPQYGTNFQHSNKICFSHCGHRPSCLLYSIHIFCGIRYLANLSVESSFSFAFPVQVSGRPLAPWTFFSHSSAIISVPIVLSYHCYLSLYPQTTYFLEVQTFLDQLEFSKV